MLKEVIKKYQQTYSVLESTVNTKTHLTAIVSFFEFCGKNGSADSYEKFIGDFIVHLIKIFKDSTISFVDPYLLNASKYILQQAKKIETEEIIISEINNITELINIRLLLSYFYLGEIENGKTVLMSILNSKVIIESGVSMNDYKEFTGKNHSKQQSLVNPNLFKVNKVFDILRQINYEITRLNSSSKEEINILLVESDNSRTGIKSFGIVQSLTCSISVKKKQEENNPFIENILDIDEIDLSKTRKEIASAAEKLLTPFKVKLNLCRKQINLKFRDLTGIYKGTSFGAGAALLISAAYLNSIYSRNRFSISSSAAFTGQVDKYGNMLRLPEESIKIKVEAAFFSWVRYIVLPEENLPEARETIRNLNKIYPRKGLEIIGCKNIADVFENEKIVKSERDSITQYSKYFLNKYKAASYIITILIMVFVTTILTYAIIPKSIKPLPQNLYPNYIVYAPDRDSQWVYSNPNRIDQDTLHFGEVAIGNVMLYRFELWNNGDEDNPLVYELSGKDKDEFEVTGFEEKPSSGIKFIYMPDKLQNLILKFTPYKTEGKKEADLIFYPKNNPTDRKTIHLKGTSDYYKGGYSLKLRGDNEFIVNPQKGNILENEFTISFWYKVNMVEKDGTYLLSDEDQNWTKTKFTVEINKDTNLSLLVLFSKSEPLKNFRIESRTKIKLGEWNYVAISHKDNMTTLISNNDIITKKTTDNHFQQYEDYFFWGTRYHPKTNREQARHNAGSEQTFSEIRMYNKALTTRELFSKKHKKENPSDKRLLLYYDFEESDDKCAFDKTNNDINSDLRQNPYKVLDIPPLILDPKKSSFKSDKDICLRITKKGQAILYKNLIKEVSGFTIQIDAMIKKTTVTSYNSILKIANIDFSIGIKLANIDGYLLCGANQELYNPSKKDSLLIDEKWHRYTFDYDKEKNSGRVFVDGKLIEEYRLTDTNHCFLKNIYFIIFGASFAYYNPRYILEEESYIDNIAIYNRVLNSEEISNSAGIKSIPGLLAYWDFSNVRGNNAFDLVNNIPLFLWDDFDLTER